MFRINRRFVSPVASVHAERNQTRVRIFRAGLWV